MKKINIKDKVAKKTKIEKKGLLFRDSDGQSKKYVESTKKPFFGCNIRKIQELMVK